MILLCISVLSGTCFAWADKVHMAMGDAAGYNLSYNLAAPDIAEGAALLQGILECAYNPRVQLCCNDQQRRPRLPAEEMK